MLGGALAWAGLPAGTTCMVKDALKALFSVGFTKVLEAKPPSPVVQVLSSSVLRRCNKINVTK